MVGQATLLCLLLRFTDIGAEICRTTILIHSANQLEQLTAFFVRCSSRSAGFVRRSWRGPT